MIKFVAHLKTIAAAPLALAAILFSFPAVADGSAQHLYLATNFGGPIDIVTPTQPYTLNAHHAGNSAIFDTQIAFASQAVTYTAPEIVGYTFNGWYRAKDLISTTYSSFPTSAADYPDCISTSFAFSPQDSFRQTTCKFQSGGGFVGFTALYMAKYEVATYRVDFANNGKGISSLPEAMTATGGETITLSKLTDNSNGYRFETWCEDAELTRPVKLDDSGKYQPRSSITLYAYWIPKSFRIDFSPNYGTVSPDFKTVTYGESFGELPTPTRAGYRFLGWSLNGHRITAETEVTITTSVTLTAEWEKIDYRIAIHSNFKGRYEEKEGSIAFIPDYTTVTIETASTYKFIAPGLRFLGWDFDPDALEPCFGTTFTEIGETFAQQLKEGETTVDLYAIWKVLTYTVHFEAPDATSGMMEDQVIERDCAVALSANAFVRIGWKFDQWSDGTTSYEDGEEVRDLAAADETITLTAKWSPIAYRIEFDGNCPSAGALLTEPPSSLALNYDAQEKLPNWDPQNTIAEFKGWALSPNADVSDFENGKTIINLASEEGAVVILYAVWDFFDLTLSAAVGCDSLAFETSPTLSGLFLLSGWSPLGALGMGLSSGVAKSSRDDAEVEGTPSWLQIRRLIGRGTLVFTWEQDEKAGFKVCFEYGEGVADKKKKITASVGRATQRIRFETDGEHQARWKAWGEAGNARIYSIRWIPEGVNPEPTEADRPVITTDFTFATKPDFDYVIWEATTLENGGDWVAGDPIEGDGTAITLPMFEDPQGFFKVQVIQRGSR